MMKMSQILSKNETGWKTKKLGKDEYWTPNLIGDKKIETMDMETGFIEEEFQDGEEEG